VRPDITARSPRHHGVRQALHFRAGRFFQPVPRVTRAGQVLQRPRRGRRLRHQPGIGQELRLIVTGFYRPAAAVSRSASVHLVVGPRLALARASVPASPASSTPNAKSHSSLLRGTYFNRNYTLISPGNYLGFGFPGSSSANRSFRRARPATTTPSLGTRDTVAPVHWEYAYLSRAPWSVPAGTPSTAHAHMLFGSMRLRCRKHYSDLRPFSWGGPPGPRLTPGQPAEHRKTGPGGGADEGVRPTSCSPRFLT